MPATPDTSTHPVGATGSAGHPVPPPAGHPAGGLVGTAQAHPAAAAVVLCAAVGVFALWRGSRNRAKRVAAQAREATRAVSLAGRMLTTAAAIVAGQWLVFAYVAGTSARLAALGVPAIFAAHTLTRAVTITGHTSGTHRGGRR